jgi:hypothetical protein
VSALPNGDLLALWYGGSREGAADVAVFTSRMTAGTKTWGPPVKVLDRASVTLPVPASIEPARSKSAAVMLNAPLLVVSVFPAASRNVPVPSPSESAFTVRLPDWFVVR